MTNLKPMTFYQEVIYKSIIEYNKKNKEMPSIREIGKMANLSSPATVHKHLHNLEMLGYIEITGSKKGIILK